MVRRWAFTYIILCYTEERIRERAEVLERRKKELAERVGSNKKKGRKKAVKHLMSQIFHMPNNSHFSQGNIGKDEKNKSSPNSHNPLLSNNTSWNSLVTLIYLLNIQDNPTSNLKPRTTLASRLRESKKRYLN